MKISKQNNSLQTNLSSMDSNYVCVHVDTFVHMYGCMYVGMQIYRYLNERISIEN